MNFLTTLAIVLCGAAILVDAEYWVEFRAARSSRSRSQHPAMVNHIYECRGDDPEIPAFMAAESQCTPVRSYEARAEIYSTCNFCSVYRPSLNDHVIQFTDRRRTAGEVTWYIGYTTNNIDHPDFAQPGPGHVANFRAKVEQLGDIVPQQTADLLAEYLAVTNVMAFSGMANNPSLHLQAYGAVLYRITNLYGTSNQRRQLGVAMRLVFDKMIDPCIMVGHSVMPTVVNQLCVVYCNFLNVVAQHFGPSSQRCSSLEGGICQAHTCICYRMLSTVFEGCSDTSSPMRLCNNEMRARLTVL